jgi:hypothetical protein
VQTSQLVEDVELDLVLQTRLGLLHSSLNTVLRVLGDIEQTRKPNQGMITRADALTTLANTVEEGVSTLRGLLRDAMATLAREGIEILNALERACFDSRDSEDTYLDRQLLSFQHTSVGSDLREDVKDRLEELASIQAKVTSAQNTAEEHDELVAAAWNEYAKFHERCEGVFAEYVDLVRGVLVRDAGLDRDLCRIGDQLVRLWGRFKDYHWQSFTIPAATERGGMSAARLIRIGFPEWSVWSLALTAHEFGHVFASKHDRMRKFVDDNVTIGVASEAEIQTWVADVFATAVMGAAYVWAAMLLRADPASLLDAARVTVMLKTLETLDEEDEYLEDRERLKRAWEGARPRVEPAEPAVPALDLLLNRVVDEVYPRVPDVLHAAEWEQAIELVDRLEDESVSPQELAEDLQLGDLRRVLFAAWYARLRLTKPGSPHHADGSPNGHHAQLQSLAERTRSTCITLIERADQIDRGSASPGLMEQPSSPSNRMSKRPPNSWRVQT